MAPTPTIRRLLKETAELSSSATRPNPAFYAQPVSEADVHEWHFILLGPPSPSPYAGGLYHGRITLPATYPLKPPNFRFLTPSGRFETNREICLSISGFHEETWMPAWGVRTALTALRTFMAEQGTAGQVGGLEAPKNVRERLARESRNWRCESCGGKTNAEIMDCWWEVCRGKGVQIGGDGEEVAMEGIAEDVKIEARPAPGSNQAHGEAAESHATTEQQPTSDTRNTTLQRVHEETQLLSQSGLLPSDPALQDSGAVGDRQQLHRRNRISSLSQPNATPLPMTTSLDTARGVSLPAQGRNAESSAVGPGNITTIDKAIGAILLALVLMVLKKVFYPASTHSLDDFYLPDG